MSGHASGTTPKSKFEEPEIKKQFTEAFNDNRITKIINSPDFENQNAKDALDNLIAFYNKNIGQVKLDDLISLTKKRNLSRKTYKKLYKDKYGNDIDQIADDLFTLLKEFHDVVNKTLLTLPRDNICFNALLTYLKTNNLTDLTEWTAIRRTIEYLTESQKTLKLAKKDWYDSIYGIFEDGTCKKTEEDVINEIIQLGVDIGKIDILTMKPENKGVICEQILHKVGNLWKSVTSGVENIIFYGVPGCGKSFNIMKYISKQKYIKDKGFPEDEFEEFFNNRSTTDISSDDKDYQALWKNDNIQRIVFHPDYTYSDFIGQILPKVVPTVDKNGNIVTTVTYDFRPGPFTKILKEAIKRKDERFFLIIEEINRGNAASIFGDVFQLLDRVEREDKGKKIIESEYPINNLDIAKVVYDIDEENTFKQNQSKKGNQKDIIYYNKDNKKVDDIEIKIPDNLWLIATMNTSDQNVFTLDTAFQRRWNMELIVNTFKNVPKFYIEGTNVTWEAFAKAANTEIVKGNNTITSEDKRLGAWFVKPDAEKEDTKDKFITRKYFANKVLKYLWDDAFKLKRKNFFNAEYNTLEEVIIAFMKCKNVLIDSIIDIGCKPNGIGSSKLAGINSEEPVNEGGEEPVNEGGEEPVNEGEEEPVNEGGEEPDDEGGED